MIAILIIPFYIIYNYLLYKLLIKWLKIFNKYFNYKIASIILLITQIFLSSSFIIAFFIKIPKLRRFLYFIGNYWFGVVLYIILFSIIALILKKIFHKTIIKYNTEKIYAISGLVLIFFVLATSTYGIINARIIKLKNYNIHISKKTNMDHLNITLVADTHIGYNITSKQITNMVNKINELNADVVLIAGDIFDNEYGAIDDPEKIKELFKSIKSKYGVYACYGNHDIEEKIMLGFTFKSQKKKESNILMDKLLVDSNIKLLKDEKVLINDSVYIYGRPDYSRPNRGITSRKTPKEITSVLDKSKPIITLDHQPRELEELGRAGVDLDLSGHTHNGQIFPLQYIMKLKFPNSYGLKTYGNMKSITTSGVGLFGPNMRVLTDAEIVNISVTFN